MPKTVTHNAIILRPPPGTRFTIFGSDVELQFARGEERKTFEWLNNWLQTHVAHEVMSAEQPAHDPTPDITALRAQIEADQAARKGSPGISQSEQKLAALAIPPTQNHVHYNSNPAPPPFVPKPGVPVVYGPNGPMTETEVNALTDKPIPGVGYVGPTPPPSQPGT